MTEEKRAELEKLARACLTAKGDNARWEALDALENAANPATVLDLLATIARLEAEKVKDGEALSDGLYALESAAAVVLHLNGTTNRNREAAMTAIRARLSSRAKDQSQ